MKKQHGSVEFLGGARAAAGGGPADSSAGARDGWAREEQSSRSESHPVLGR